jgi:membrane protein YqaA with SNARE-associated domain
MIFNKLHELISEYAKLLQRYADRYWFAPLIGLLAALDNFVIIIPNEGILISSSMVIPKRWFIFALNIAIGSTLGALALAALVEFQGLPFILKIFPGINETTLWAMMLKFFERYGLFFIFVVAITPIAQQPSIILASLANTPFLKLALVVFLGRSIKFFILAYAATHAPRLLSKIWGVKKELKEVGIELKKD